VTAELIEALDVEPTAFGRQIEELDCRPCPSRISAQDGTSCQGRGYLIADIRAAIAALHDAPDPMTAWPEPVTITRRTRITNQVTSHSSRDGFHPCPELRKRWVCRL
jgi:hypothetical protein